MNLEHLAKSARTIMLSSAQGSSPTTRALGDILSQLLDHLIAENADEGPSCEPLPTRALDIPAALRRGVPPGVPDPTTAAIEQLTRERDDAIAGSRANSERAGQLHGEREQVKRDRDAAVDRAIRAEGQLVDIRDLQSKLSNMRGDHAEQGRKLEHAQKRAQLADLEWNNARTALNPLIAPEFDGQTLVDAVTHTIQMLEAKVRSAQEAGQRAHDDAQRIQKVLAAHQPGPIATTQIDKLRAQKAGHLSTIADQAKQIHELRETIGRRNNEHTAELHRQAATWEQDRKAGAEQVRKLIEDNDRLRTAIVDRDRIMSLLSGATVALERLAAAAGYKPGSREDNESNVLAQLNRWAECKGQIAEHDATCRQYRERITQLEQQAARRDKLGQVLAEQQNELRDSVQTMADEAFGPFPVLSTDEALEAIGMGIARQRFARQRRDLLVEAVEAWIEQPLLKNEIALPLATAFGRYQSAEKEAQAKDEAAMLEFLRGVGSQPDPAEPGDCQQGTCECGTVEIAEINKLVSDAADPAQG